MEAKPLPNVSTQCSYSVNNPGSFRIDLLCFISTISGLTMCGNLLVITSILYFQQLQSPTNYLVLSLAVADLLVGVVVLPFSAVLYANPCWHLQGKLCHVRATFDIMLSICSILNLCFISVDRYFAVCQPLSYRTKITFHVIATMILISWTVPALCGIIITIGGRSQTKFENGCAFFRISNLNVIGSTAGFYIPIIIMFPIYTKIFLVARRQAQRIHGCTSGAAVSKMERKATRTLAIVVGVFVVCWAPFMISMTCLPFVEYTVSDSVFEAFKWFGWSNSMLNPFIYGFFYSWFRSAFRIILSGKIFTRNMSHTELL